MDPIAHTLTGAALASAGLRRATPLAAPILVIAANAPDVDIVTYFAGGEYSSLALRRGWTHGVLALALWPFVLTGLMLGWDRLVRRARDPAAAPARAGPLLLLAAVGVLTHPALDWLNNYGMRWLMPFDGRWFYGDALFIIDPWIWLALGGALFLAHSATAAGVVAWALLAAAASALMLGSELVSVPAKIVWIAGLVAFAAARLAAAPRSAAAERYVRAALASVALYMTALVTADGVARADVSRSVEAAGRGPVESVMVAPVPADLLGSYVVVATPSAYLSGSFHWARRPRFIMRPHSIPRDVPPDLAAAVEQDRDVRDYLVWARFPFYRVETLPDGYRVLVGDARYADFAAAGSLRGLVVELDRDLRPRTR